MATAAKAIITVEATNKEMFEAAPGFGNCCAMLATICDQRPCRNCGRHNPRTTPTVRPTMSQTPNGSPKLEPGAAGLGNGAWRSRIGVGLVGLSTAVAFTGRA